MSFKEVIWHPIHFVVPALKVPVFTKIDKKTVKKRDAFGAVVYDERIIPKGRPRLGKFGNTHTPETTVAFEKWIRAKFFEEYPGDYGIMYHNKAIAVDEFFIGCQRFGEDKPCILFRNGAGFKSCINCAYRRRNLRMDMDIFFKDERLGDKDNIEKIVQDSLNKVCFFDDTQIIAGEPSVYLNSEVERIEVTISKMPMIFKNGVLVGGYSFKKLSILEAKEFVTFIVKKGIIKEPDYEGFIKYFNRCDTRKYVKEITLDKLKELA